MLPPPIKNFSTIISSCNKQDNVEKTFQFIKNILKPSRILFQVIYIGDGSNDLTYSNFTNFSKKNPKVKGLSFSENFGKETAIFAGINLPKASDFQLLDDKATDAFFPVPEYAPFFLLEAYG